jgi:hypothetical protein
MGVWTFMVQPLVASIVIILRCCLLGVEDIADAAVRRVFILRPRVSGHDVDCVAETLLGSDVDGIVKSVVLISAL